MRKAFENIFLFNFIFFVLIFFYFQFENQYFLNNSIFPFDAIVYKDLAISLFDNNYKDTIDYTSTLIYYPHTSKVLYPLIIGFINKYLNINLIFSMFYINLISIYLTCIIAFILLSKFVKNNLLNLLVIFLYLIIWNSQLRASFYNPAGGFAFDTFLISLLTYSIFMLDEQKKSHFILICFFLILLSLQRFVIASFVLILPIIFEKFNSLNFKKINIKSLLKINLNIQTKIKLFILIVIFFIIFLNADQHGTYSRIKFILKFLYFHSNPFEFIYTYYYAYGAFFFIFVYVFLDKKFRKKIFSKLNILSTKQKNFFYSVILISIILSTIGGDDSDRMLLWFFIWHLILVAIVIEIIIDQKKKLLITIFIIVHIFGSRILTQGIPHYTISDTFLYYSQQTTTNFKDELFQGPKILKKFRNKLTPYKLITIPGIHLENKSKQIITYLPDGKIKLNGTINIYNQAYKYRLNDIPFPFGYLHNQRNAHVDHPWHGKWWVRFLFIFQWLSLQIFIFIFYNYKKIIFKLK